MLMNKQLRLKSLRPYWHTTVFLSLQLPGSTLFCVPLLAPGCLWPQEGTSRSQVET